MNEEPVKLVSTKPDADKAKDFRAELELVLAPVRAVMDKITDAGLSAAWNIGPDYRKKNVVNLIKIVKEYT